MSAPQFTPGPWLAGPSDYRAHKTLVRAGDLTGRRIADTFCQMSGGDPTTNEANALLIAAAPELCEALERATAMIDGDNRATDRPSDYRFNVVSEFKSLLAKARGEQVAA